MKAKFSKGLFVATLFLTTASGHASFSSDNNVDGSEKQETQNPPKEENVNVNVPEDVREQIQDVLSDHAAYCAEIAKNIPKTEADPEAEAIVKEALENWEKQTGINLETHAQANPPPQRGCLTENLNNYRMDTPPTPRILRPIFVPSFELMARLSGEAQEPLFLDNKYQFSVEIRPFFGFTNIHDMVQLGSVLTARKQWSDKYISGQLLYGFSFNLFGSTHDQNSGRSDNDQHDVLAAFTFGKNIGRNFSGALTASMGFSWSDYERNWNSCSFKSKPKALYFGLSPILVYYLPIKVPLDLFLGGDVYYWHGFGFEETSSFSRVEYHAFNDILWRVKAGPSYTMKREGKARLHQLKTSLGLNVQSQIPDRFTVAPNLLFESQPLEGRGGYLFNLGFNLGSQKKSWQLAYGLRF